MTEQSGNTEPGLMGTAWRLEAYGPADAPITPPEGAEATISFREDGRVGGFSGCNRFTGPYQIEGDEIVFGTLTTTRMACLGEERQRQERAVLAALRGDVRFELAGDALRLFGPDDTFLILAATPPDDDE